MLRYPYLRLYSLFKQAYPLKLLFTVSGKNTLDIRGKRGLKLLSPSQSPLEVSFKLASELDLELGSPFSSLTTGSSYLVFRILFLAFLAASIANRVNPRVTRRLTRGGGGGAS